MKLGCTDKVTNGQISNLGDADPTFSVGPKMLICVTESWQPKLGGTGMESVAPKWLGFGWVCLGFGIGGTEVKIGFTDFEC